MATYNKAQEKAVMHGEGPLLVVSGAGTGKTHVLTSRILHLLKEKRVSPSEILALTFTEKATQEMVERIDNELPLGLPEIWIHTFHGFCDRILRERGVEIGIPMDYKIFSNADLWLFLTKHALDFKLEYYRSLGNPQKFLYSLQEYFSRLKDFDIAPEAYEQHIKKIAERAKTPEEKEIAEKGMEVARVYQIYEELLIKNGYIDFAGLIFYTLQLFKKRPSVLREYQDRFRFILVDEFQDTNYAQNMLVTLLSKQHQNLFVVGDDDQAIYKWRGASLTNIEYFLNNFPEAKKIVLTENYRSSQEILDAAYGVIQKNNPNRLEVTLSIDKRLQSRIGQGDLPEIYHWQTLEEEAQWVSKTAASYLKKGMDIAILVRTNSLATPFLAQLRRTYTPLQHFSESGVFQKAAVKDCMAVLRSLRNPWDDIALFRCLTLPCFQIPMETVRQYTAAAKGSSRSLFDVIDSPPALRLKNLLATLLEYSRQHRVSEVLGRFLTESGYIEWAKRQESSAAEDIAMFSEKISEFEETHEYKSLEDFLIYSEMLEVTGDFEHADTPLDPAAIKVMTVHAAKGLEFDCVFVPGTVQNKFPGVSRRDTFEIPEELIPEPLPEGNHHQEEERRLFYVACTRARKKLILSYSDFYASKKPWKPSIFVMEMLETGKAVLRNFVKKRKISALQGTLGLKERSHRPLKLSIPALSYSQMETFRTCPLKYQFRYLFALPAAPSPQMNFGISIHNTLRDFFAYMQKNPEETTKNLLPLLITLYEKNWISAGYGIPEFSQDQKKRGKTLLEKFYDFEKGHFNVPAYLEKSFTLRFSSPSLTITGRIDRIDKLADGTYEVIDYKTGENKEKNLKNDLQISLYALACRETLKIPISKLTLYFLNGLSKVSTTRTDEELDLCKEEIAQCAKEIAESEFSPTPGYHCGYCDYRQICPAAVVVNR